MVRLSRKPVSMMILGGSGVKTKLRMFGDVGVAVFFGGELLIGLFFKFVYTR